MIELQRAHGYPSRELIAAISGATFANAAEAFELAEAYFNQCGYGRAWRTQSEEGEELRFATGGWSGCEEVISTMEQNHALMYAWESSHRGGLYVFLVGLMRVGR